MEKPAFTEQRLRELKKLSVEITELKNLIYFLQFTSQEETFRDNNYIEHPHYIDIYYQLMIGTTPLSVKGDYIKISFLPVKELEKLLKIKQDLFNKG